VNEVEKPKADISKVDRAIAELGVHLFREHALKRVDLAGQTAMSAWRGLTLVNGGAIVALFTLVGSGNVAVEAGAIWKAFAAFSVGLTLSLSSNICGYYGQAYYLQLSLKQLWNAQNRMHGRPGKRVPEKGSLRGSIAEYIGIGAAIGALISFVVGASFALSAALLNAPQQALPALVHPVTK